MTQRHGRFLLRAAVLLVAVGMIAGHGFALRSIADYATWPGALVLGVIILAAPKHLGMLGALYAFLRRSRRNSG